jgi:hypothetical protein
MKLVIIESPYAGKSSLIWPLSILDRMIDRWRNVRYARACVRDSLRRGEAPIASHLLYTQRGILDDDVPAERTWGIKAGFAWGHVAALRVFYVDRGFSGGMKWGREEADRLAQAIEYRSLSGGLVAAIPAKKSPDDRSSGLN